jgi:hypothetical protein
MRSLLIAFIAILFTTNCNFKKEESVVEKIQHPLELMETKWHHYLSHFQNWDSLQQQLNLTTLRYELQGLQYEIEIIFIPPGDSLNWVAGQYMASTYFDLSWNELPIYIKAVNSKEYLKALDTDTEMEEKEKRAIDYYLKNIKPFSPYNQQYWDKHLKDIHQEDTIPKYFKK